MFSAEDGVEFGWVSQYSDNLDDAIYNGQYCQGAWAYQSAADTGVCFTIDKITDQSDTELVAPYACDPTDTDNKCRYYADDTNYVEVSCECAYNGNGYCPKPGPTDTASYVKFMNHVFGNSTCHTLDKRNLNAQIE